MKKTSLFLVLGTKLLASSITEQIPEYEFSGNHYVASYMQCDHEALINLNSLKEELSLSSS